MHSDSVRGARSPKATPFASKASVVRRAVTEALEGRVLLAAAPPATDAVAEASAKVARSLTGVLKEFKAHKAKGLKAEKFKARDRLLDVSQARVAVQVLAAPGKGDALERDLKKLGLTGASRHGLQVGGQLPLAAVGRLAALPSVRYARPVWYKTHAITGQSDKSMRADRARPQFDVDGTGVKIGIISDSFDGSTDPIDYEDDVLSGDLPSDVQILRDAVNELDEGRAMAQLIHDTAPGAKLAFSTALILETDFAASIRALRDAGADIIVDDLVYLAEPMFQDGVVSQAVDEVVADGVAFFSAAGNMALQSYESSFRGHRVLSRGSIPVAPGVPPFTPFFEGGVTHDFNPDPSLSDDLQQFTLDPGDAIELSYQWDQPFFSVSQGGRGASSNVDIYVLNQNGTQVLGGAAEDNRLSGDPVEVFYFANTTAVTQTYNLMIVNRLGPNPGRMKYINFANYIAPEYATDSGTVFGHANARGAAAIGAANWFRTPEYGVTPAEVTPYSSKGGTDILFNTDGTRKTTPEERGSKPLLAAPDGANTTFFSDDADEDADSLPNFFGTSAAAPSAAAVAALMLEVNPNLGPEQLYELLQSTAEATDDDEIKFIRADDAVEAAGGTVIGGGGITGRVFQDKDSDAVVDANESGQVSVTVYLDANNNALFDQGETFAVTAADGTFSFTNLDGGTYRVRQVTPTGHVQINPGAPGYFLAAVSGPGVVSPGNFANFPIVYTGALGAASDSYTLRRDPANPTWIQILAGATPTYRAPFSLVPSLTFDLGAGEDTLNVDYASGSPVVPGGVVYDAGIGSDDLLNVTGSNFGDNITLVHADDVSPGTGVIGLRSVDRVFANTSGGNDVLTVGQRVFAAVAYQGGADFDSLSFSASNSSDEVDVRGASVVGGGNTVNHGGLEQVTVDALAGADNIRILSGASGLSYTVRGGSEDDAAVLSQAVSSPVTFDGGAGTDAFTFNGSGGNDDVAVTGFSVAGGGNSLTYANTESLVVDAGFGNDTVSVSNGVAGTSWTVRGGEGNDTITLAPGSFTPLGVEGGGGTDTFAFNGSPGNDLVAVAQGAISGAGNSATYSGIEALNVNTAGGDDGVEISSTAAGTPVTVNGGTGDDTLTIASAPNAAGPVTFNGGLTPSDRDTLNVNAGTHTFSADAALATAHLAVNVNNGAAVTFNTTQHLAALNVAQGGTAAMPPGRNKVLVTEAVSFGGTGNAAGTLDLADNAMVVRTQGGSARAPAVAALNAALRGGHNGGAWDGRGLRSSTAAADTARRTGVGLLVNDAGNGGTSYPTFRGEGGLGVNDLLVGYALYGDANLSGNVDSIDFALLARNFGTTGTYWGTGDFNYDERVDSIDFARLAGNFGRTI